MFELLYLLLFPSRLAKHQILPGVFQPQRLHHADFFSGVGKGMIFPHSSGGLHFPLGFRNLLGT